MREVEWFDSRKSGSKERRTPLRSYTVVMRALDIFALAFPFVDLSFLYEVSVQADSYEEARRRGWEAAEMKLGPSCMILGYA